MLPAHIEAASSKEASTNTEVHRILKILKEQSTDASGSCTHVALETEAPTKASANTEKLNCYC